MADETETNPVEGDDESLLGTGVEGEATEPQLDDDGNPVEPEEPVEDDTEEVERDGQKYRVPKALKAELLMHADYTRKTQELAEQRRALETQRAQAQTEDKEAAELRATVIAEERRVATLDAEIAKYREVTPAQWAAWKAQDPLAADQALFHYQNLRETRSEVAQAIQAGKTSLSEKEATTLAQQRDVHAKQLQEGQAVLARDIKDWGPELAGKLAMFAEKEFGLSAQELAGITDPRAIKILHRAMTSTQAAKTKQVAERTQAAAAVKPTPRVTGTAAPVKGLDDRLSDAEWMRRRNEQVKAANRR